MQKNIYSLIWLPHLQIIISSHIRNARFELRLISVTEFQLISPFFLFDDRFLNHFKILNIILSNVFEVIFDFQHFQFRFIVIIANLSSIERIS